MSRDSLAMSQGLAVAPHRSVIADVHGLRAPFRACAELADIATQAASHIDRIETLTGAAMATKKRTVFIGHGQSPLWRELKDFVQDRLDLPYEEFNRVAVAGRTTVDRLREMLDAAAIAFLVLTAEDEHSNGEVLARQNVVHEAGLFQGRLGFDRAIIVLEEGCAEFSNIHGLAQIRFPKGKISAVLEEVRRVVEREGIINS